jgi:hypothetical protein
MEIENERDLKRMVDIADQWASSGVKSFSFRASNLGNHQGNLNCSNDEDLKIDHNSTEGHGIKFRGIESNLLSQSRSIFDIQFASDSPCVSSLQGEDEIEVQIGKDTGLSEDMEIVDACNMAHDEAKMIMNSAVAGFESTGEKSKIFWERMALQILKQLSQAA